MQVSKDGEVFSEGEHRMDWRANSWLVSKVLVVWKGRAVLSANGSQRSGVAAPRFRLCGEGGLRRQSR